MGTYIRFSSFSRFFAFLGVNRMYLYLYLMLFTLSAPLIRGFEPRIAYYRKWKALFPALLLVAIPFWLWDYYFTVWGVWGFNKQYLLGYYIAGLPLEEVLFFLIVPFTCIFCYEVFNYFIVKDYLSPIARPFTLFFGLFLLAVGLFNPTKAYTLWACGGAGLFLIGQAIAGHEKLGRFWFMWVVILLPKLLVNGALTGSFTPQPVVWYNDEENLGLRLFTIPLEDFAYNTLMLMPCWVLYESLKKRFSIP